MVSWFVGSRKVEAHTMTCATYSPARPPILQENTIAIAHLLGHRGTDNTHRYMHLADRPVREAAEQVSALIAKAMRGKV
jgi:hypothetical protein